LDIKKNNNIEQFNRGDKKFFQRAFDNWFDHMCYFANKFIEDIPITEDIVQEAFISLWENKEKIESDEHIKAFLYKVIRNKSLNHLKHEEIKRRYAENAIIKLESDDFFIRYVIEEETKRLIAETEKELTPKCKKVFHLSMQGYKNAEICGKLNISINTVKTHKRVANGILKSKIAKTLLLIYYFWM
jgi:RNA polymerase sigma-70 factor (ECF subfamily)